MSTLVVRNLDDGVYAQLKQVAQSDRRSMEAAARDIITESVRSQTWAQRWLEETRDLRGDELPLPQRSDPREIDFA